MFACNIRRWLTKVLPVTAIIGLTANLGLAESKFPRANRQAPQRHSQAAPRTIGSIKRHDGQHRPADSVAGRNPRRPGSANDRSGKDPGASRRPQPPADHPAGNRPVIRWSDPAEDSRIFPIPLPQTDLAALDCSLGGMYTDSSNKYQYWVRAKIQNVGMYHYAGGRNYTINAWVGASIMLQTAPIPPLAPGQTIEVKYWLPKGNKYTKFYVMLNSPSDPNPSNDVAWSK